MATYKPIRKTANGTEEIKIPYAVLADPPTIPDISGKANLSGGNTFSGLQTVNAPANSSGTEQATAKFKTANGGSITFGKEGANSGTMIRLDQTDGTCRLRFRSSATAGAMVWEQPESGAQLYIDLGARGGDYHRVQFPSSEGTLALTSQIPTSSTVSNWGFTKNTGTVTSVAVKMNGATKGTVTGSGTIDLGTVITAHQDISGKQDKITSTAKLPASLVSGLATVATSGSYNDLSNKPTILSEADVKGIKVDNATNADTAGKVENPLTILSSPSGGSIYETFLAYDGSAHKSFMFGTDFWVDQTGTPTVFLNNSGVTAGTYNSVTVDKKGRVTAGTNTPVITADGGTINKSKTVKMDASANSDGANLKWGTVNSKNPYIGYASDQTDGTFVVGSLLGTNYASGLAIGGGSGNLLWKGAKVATTSDIPNISGKLDKTAFSLSDTTLTITI